jgi:hypothetical protein
MQPPMHAHTKVTFLFAAFPFVFSTSLVVVAALGMVDTLEPGG